ncbi:MAG: RsmB/NOP family class I SAM-dependent RNA methyltransferase [Candidatus Aenigmatarchaeota archaeon]
MEIKIPKPFEEKYKKLLSKEYEKLEACLFFKPKKSIRVNTIKISSEKLVKRLEKNGMKLKQIPWYKDGFFVENEKDVVKTLEYFLGYYYIQEASSMIPPLILSPSPKDKVLDLCAAPGSKTTQIAMIMRNSGVIVANDNNLNRIKALRINLQKMGVKNCILTYEKGENFWKYGIKFDKVLVDAPCSGSGKIISTFSSLKLWSQSNVEKLSSLQKKLIYSASKCLKEKGTLVYSTCSLDPEENEEIIDFCVKNLGLSVEKIEIKNLKYREGILEWNGKKFDESIRNAIRIFPFENFTEGFFICKLKKWA